MMGWLDRRRQLSKIDIQCDTHFAPAIANRVPVFHPLHSVGIGASSWGDEHGITLIVQGLDIFHPHVGTFTRTHVGLAWFVRSSKSC